MSTFDTMAQRIIREQALIIGPLAYTEAKKISGIEIRTDGEVQIASSAQEPSIVINDLIGQYEHLFGRASIEVCKDVVQDLLTDLPKDKIPTRLVV